MNVGQVASFTDYARLTLYGGISLDIIAIAKG